MLDIKVLEAKNFLSYGDVLTKVDMYEGINLITGYDKQKKRSNGAGKTSLMEIIIFSLFGQVSKGLKQSQIINWKNKKGCETKVTFIKNDHVFTFHRGLKPNFLKVTKDGDEYPVNSSVKDFQNDLEDQVIGMDFKTFNSLIYSNPNNSISLLDTQKAQKRAFIEKQFNLTEFSELNKLNNESIKLVDIEIHDLERDIQKNVDLISSISSERETINDELKGINIDDLINKRNNLLKIINVDMIDIDDSNLIKLKSDHKVKSDTLSKYRVDEKDINNKKNVIKQELIGILSTIKALKKQKEDIGDITEHLTKLDKVKKALVLYGDVKEILEEKKKSVLSLEEQYSQLKENYNEHTSIIKGYQDRIDAYNIGDLRDKTQCPTCYQEVDYNVIKSKIDSEILMLQGHINNQKDTRDIIKTSMDDFKDSIEKKKEDIKVFEKKVETKQEFEKAVIKLEVYKNKQQEIDSIDNKINKLSNYSDKKKSIDDYDIQLKELSTNINIIDDEVSKFSKDIELLESKLKKKAQYDQDLKIVDRDIVHKRESIKSLNERLLVKDNKLIELSDDNHKFSILIKEKQVMKDHYNFIKSMLKDDNIKQFAISNLIPIIEKKTNYYLGEAGFGFYLKLDNWLDAEIKGPGISDCSFASMSGGERKSIDLALKFAIMDISVARNPNFPNILILDELLDSSVDSYGIQQLMKVIEVKQKKNKLKVYIISHRAEMDEFEPDYKYLITKENGFSSVSIKEN